MSDIVSEFQRAVIESAMRQEAAVVSQRGFDLQPAILDAFSNPADGGVALTVMDDFTTGFDSGTGATTIAFTVGISEVGGTDIVTFS